MSSPVFYAHSVENGIKIGYTNNYEKRRAQYESSGRRCKLLRICRYASRGLDSILKNTLLDYLVKDADSGNFSIKEIEEKKPCGKETYDISMLQLNIIFDHIEKNKDIISKELAISIKNCEDPQQTHLLRLRKIKSNWQDGIFRPYSHNRQSDEIRVNNIKNYIESNYNKPGFILPSLIFVVDPNNKDRMILIDGQHRMNAILLINNPDILYKKISVIIDSSAATEDDILHKFITINRSVSVQTFSFTSVEINKMMLQMKRGFIKRYGNILTHTKQLSYKVDVSDISIIFNNNDALTKLYSHYNCSFIPTAENCLELLFKMNTLLVTEQSELDSEDFTKFINDLRNTGRKKIMEKTIKKYLDAAKSYATDVDKDLCLLGFLNNADIFTIIIDNIKIGESLDESELEDIKIVDLDIKEQNSDMDEYECETPDALDEKTETIDKKKEKMVTKQKEISGEPGEMRNTKNKKRD
jgi:hypothetical protein